MSAKVVVDNDAPSQLDSTSPVVSDEQVGRRTALYLEGPGGPIFAWLHEPPVGRSLRHGVVVCPSLGYEQLHAHRTLRHLAEEAAKQGATVLRIDYHGTGDSPGHDLESGRVECWIGNAQRAASWLRESGEVDRVTWIGFRAGALFALAAAARQPADGVVLWAPPAKGNHFVREFRAVSMTAAATANLERREGEPLETSGFRLSHETCVDIGKLNATDFVPRVRRALIVSRDESPTNSRLCDHLRAAQIEATEVGGPGFADIITLPHETRVPDTTLAAIVDWLNEPINSSATEEALTNAVSSSARPSTIDRALVAEGVWERSIVLSRRPSLFGVITEPAEVATSTSTPMAMDERPCVVMVNAGSAYRIAPGRMHVELGRHLAARGWRTLRFDVEGLGDSVTRRTSRENDPYPATAMRDIGLALRELREREQAKRFVLLGLCSGAYDVFQFVAQNDDPAVVESVLINPLTFYWREGMQVEDAANLKWNNWLTYLDSALQWDKWRRLLSGQNRHGLWGTFKRFARGVGLWPQPASDAGVPALDDRQFDDLHGFGGHPERDDLRGDLTRIEKSGRHLSVFFATSDPGYLILKVRAGRKANQLERDGQLSLQFLDDSDHTFSVARARQTLIERLTSHLERRYLASGE